MRVLIAPDGFTGTLTAGQAAAALADGWARQAPADELDLCPLSDGGPGFVDTLHERLGGPGAHLEAVTVSGPLGDPVPATVLVVDGEVGRTAYVETAQACGLHLVPAEHRDPTRTTTWGVGELLDAALSTGASRIVAGLGGSATNDGGAGMLAALGAGPAALLSRGGGALADLPSDALPRLTEVRARFAGVRLVAASDVDVPLLGFHGASAGFAAQKGATPEQAQSLEAALGRYAQVAQESLGVLAGGDLLAAGSAPRRLPSTPGAGAAGGLGFGLLLLGAERVPGASAVLDALEVDQRIGRRRPGRHGGGDVRLAVPAREGRQRRRRARPGCRRAGHRGRRSGRGRPAREPGDRDRVQLRRRVDGRGGRGRLRRPRRDPGGPCPTRRPHLVPVRRVPWSRPGTTRPPLVVDACETGTTRPEHPWRSLT